MPKLKSQIRKEQAEVLANAIKSEPKQDWGKIAQKELKDIIEDLKRKNELKKRKDLGVVEAIGVTQYGDVVNIIAAVDDGDKRIISDKEEAAKKEQQKEHFEKEEEKKKRRKEPDPRGPYVQFIRKKASWSRLVDKYAMLMSVYADFDQHGVLIDQKTKLPFNGLELRQELGIGPDHFKKIMKEMLAEKALIPMTDALKRKGKNYNYRLNEDFFNINGRKLAKEEMFTKVFQEKLKQIIKVLKAQNEGVIGNEIGILRIMTQYFHFQTFYLCKNPDDKVLSNEKISVQENMNLYGSEVLKRIKFLSIAELMDKTEIKNQNDMLMMLEKLHNAGAISIKARSNGKRKDSKRIRRRILVHPDLMYRSQGHGNDDYAMQVKLLEFEIFEIPGGEDNK